MKRSKIVQALPGHRWNGVVVSAYKADGSRHRDIARQTLVGDQEDDTSGAVLRYFEIQPDGYSSLERHQHEHVVVVLCGRGEVILGDSVEALAPNDCVYVAPDTFHQFHATAGVPLGFLCLVDRVRDRPVAPTTADIEILARNPQVARLMKV